MSSDLGSLLRNEVSGSYSVQINFFLGCFCSTKLQFFGGLVFLMFLIRKKRFIASMIPDSVVH